MKTKSSVKQVSEKDSSALQELFVDSLKDIYWAEKHLAKALPKLAKAATSDDLKAAFELHTTETETHVERLEQIFELVGQKAVAKKCEAMEGLLKESDSIKEDTEKGTLVRDCGLILAAQKVEHYEIASYGGLRTLAQKLGLDEVAGILQTTLDEEGTTDKKLTELAESYVNEEAAQED
ncbi:ferritin-like domain-containing protein [Siphonobacter sp. SORGH_AS_0500]|uniref:YciE/YciF ferroxidase family protein n=1 Tax=Siphonobacter sp. SORGH_AS_0500 TaxID=1864824 RepID=UPI0028652E51|nr:ferritin-like domain-containing protein [Siphonobacter sp. SORGH_AS_0500]MDR6197382.1 ferritin-like metal-binding protein YciE [Siphonobacter sp. SORGH_AS_0500]